MSVKWGSTVIKGEQDSKTWQTIFTGGCRWRDPGRLQCMMIWREVGRELSHGCCWKIYTDLRIWNAACALIGDIWGTTGIQLGVRGCRKTVGSRLCQGCWKHWLTPSVQGQNSSLKMMDRDHMTWHLNTTYKNLKRKHYYYYYYYYYYCKANNIIDSSHLFFWEDFDDGSNELNLEKFRFLPSTLLVVSKAMRFLLLWG